MKPPSFISIFLIFKAKFSILFAHVSKKNVALLFANKLITNVLIITEDSAEFFEKFQNKFYPLKSIITR